MRTVGRHPPAGVPAARGLGDRPLSEGRVDASQRAALKHRLARSLFLYGLCNGWICEGTTIVEASSGSTAVSEAYFARMLGLPFVAVMPAGSQPRERRADRVPRRVAATSSTTRPQVYAESHRLAAECGGHFIDQFTFAERATDWRGNNNIAESIFETDGPGAPSRAVVGGRRRRDRRDVRNGGPVRAVPSGTRPGCASSTRSARRSLRGLVDRRRVPVTTGGGSRIEGIGLLARRAVVKA